MSTINYTITIGNTILNSAQNPNTQINAIELQTGIAPLVDFIKIRVGAINKPEADMASQAMSAGAGALSAEGTSAEINGSSVKTGDDMSVELGYDDNLTIVFNGTLANIEPDISNTVLVGSNGAEIMTKTRINQTYQNQGAGQIVSDLANQAGIETDVVENGIDFPYYVVDDRKHAFEHAIELAKKSGMDLYFTPENKLMMKKFSKTSADHTFIYGEDIIELQISNHTPKIEQVLISGESPASSQGNDAWHWFAKDNSSFQGSAGNGNTVLIQEPSIRTKEGANIYASGKLDLITRAATHGRIKILGNPAVKLGDAISIGNVPTESLNGLFQVRGIKHSLSIKHGFTTTVDFITASSGDGLGAL